MRITRFYIDGYKNLSKCEIQPNGIHAVTGCNAVGKSNFLDALTFLKSILDSRESERLSIFSGRDLDGKSWYPFGHKDRVATALKIDLQGEISLNGEDWLFEYELRSSVPKYSGESDYSAPEDVLSIGYECLAIKKASAPGKMRNVLLREESGTTTYSSEVTRINRKQFVSLPQMPSISMLAVRESVDFKKDFPVAWEFLKGISDISIVALDPNFLFRFNQTYPATDNTKSMMESFNRLRIISVDLFENFEDIVEDDKISLKSAYWCEYLLRITKINPETKINKKSSPIETTKRLFIYQDGKVLFPSELSTGSIALLALLSIILLPSNNGKTILIEEPEAYLHPKAISDLMTLLKNLAEDRTIVISTHSPIILNSLNADQVSVIRLNENNLAFTTKVSDIDEAVDVLERGYVSFGDMLQNNFEP